MKNRKTIYAILILGFGLYGQSKFHKNKLEATPEQKDSLIKSGFKTRKINVSKSSMFKSDVQIDQKIGEAVQTFKNSKPYTLINSSVSNDANGYVHISSKSFNQNFSNSRLSTENQINSYLSEISLKTGNKRLINGEFKIKSSFTDNIGIQHIKLQQYYKNYPVYGAELNTHHHTDGVQKSINGFVKSISSTDEKVSIDSAQATKIAFQDLATKTKITTCNDSISEILKWGEIEISTVWLFDEKSKNANLVYHLELHPNMSEHWEYFIKTSTGEIVNSFKTSCHAAGPATTTAKDLNNVTRTVNSYNNGTTYELANITKSMYSASTGNGAIITYDAKNTYGSAIKANKITSTTNTWSATAVSAHFNASTAYDYFKNVHSRNSIDNKGGSIYSFINVLEEDGSSMDNAYWNGKAMFYGNGNVAFKPLAGGLDVGGHEMTHGVVQNSANLAYQDESGAINESMADIFGCMMDSTDWLIGEDVVKTLYFPSGALRSLSDPHNGGTSLNDNGYQPKHMNEKYTGSSDNGGVHINSGIPNYAFYLFATSINSRYRASLIFYRALTVYLTQNSNFYDLRVSVLQAAKDLYGENSNEYTKAGQAFDNVGIKSTGTSSQETTGSTLETNPGEEFILCYNTESTDANGLYITDLTDFQAISSLIVANKPSITDDGKTAYFVHTNKKIYSISTNPADIGKNTLKVVNGTAMWSNVAVSKDGSKLAAVSIYSDTSIYIINLKTNEIGRFEIYNPTFGSSKSSGPVYADGLDWDYTGENLVYDAFNKINGTTSTENLEYWDINIMNVWNNKTNTFGSGDVFKLISNLESGESIGNPSFSKTSQYIMAFDYENTNTNENYVIGVNMETNDLNIIAVNTSLGWPSYSKDDKFVLFSELQNNLVDYKINFSQLNTDKISSDFDSSPIINGAKWGIFYALGNRILDEVKDETFTYYTNIYPNPCVDYINLGTINNIEKVEIFNSNGIQVDEKYFGELNNNILQMSNLMNGVYTLKIITKNETLISKISKVSK
ncbi:MAG: M4 family metallopeptidase [Cytophagales bacterium]